MLIDHDSNDDDANGAISVDKSTVDIYIEFNNYDVSSSPASF